MPEPGAAPRWVAAAPLGAARWTLVRITRRGVGMTFAAAGFWLAMAAVAAFAGLDPAMLALVLAVGGALVYPAGYLLNRALGGDLLARGSELRGLVGAITVGQALGWPLLVALLALEVRVVAFALAGMLGAHFLPYGWLYHAPGYYVLGIASVAVGAAAQAFAPAQANLLIPLAMAVLYAGCAGWVHRQNRREGAAC
ncbi:MAG TPA: hypothetical protein VIG68_06470 [Lysobacter sp.]